MTAAYAYTPAIWPPLSAAVFLAALGLYGWRRRAVHGALPLVAGALFGVLWLLGVAVEAAAVAPETKIASYKFQALWQLPAITAMTCFALEYSHPGRWLTRRNLTLLAVPPSLLLLFILANDSQLLWRRLEIGADGSVAAYPATVALIMLAYGLGLALAGTAAFLWLFIRSPQHRWPVALMLFGQIAGRGLYLWDIARWPSLTPLDPLVTGLVLVWTTYAIALFGFRIFDPLPAGRATAIEQMREGMVVFDSQTRVASLNPAAERILGASAARLRGKTLHEIVPAFPDPNPCRDTGAKPAEVRLGTGPDARDYSLELSPLQDFRGLSVGHLLLLHDVTEQHRAQAQVVEGQRAAAMLSERERLARELHDDLGQVLGYVKMQAQAAREQLAQDHKEEADDYLAQLITVAQEAHADVREYIVGAKMAPGEQPGILPALEQYLRQFAANYRIRAELIAPPELCSDAFDPIVQAHLLRIIQEALTNARKHARARCVQVRFQPEGSRARITIQDDGSGFDPDLAATSEGGHFGLRLMRERAEEVGGTLAVLATPGQGTQIVVHVPLTK